MKKQKIAFAVVWVVFFMAAWGLIAAGQEQGPLLPALADVYLPGYYQPGFDLPGYYQPGFSVFDPWIDWPLPLLRPGIEVFFPPMLEPDPIQVIEFPPMVEPGPIRVIWFPPMVDPGPIRVIEPPPIVQPGPPPVIEPPSIVQPEPIPVIPPPPIVQPEPIPVIPPPPIVQPEPMPVIQLPPIVEPSFKAGLGLAGAPATIRSLEFEIFGSVGQHDKLPSGIVNGLNLPPADPDHGYDQIMAYGDLAPDSLGGTGAVIVPVLGPFTVEFPTGYQPQVGDDFRLLFAHAFDPLNGEFDADFWPGVTVVPGAKFQYLPKFLTDLPALVNSLPALGTGLFYQPYLGENAFGIKVVPEPRTVRFSDVLDLAMVCCGVVSKPGTVRFGVVPEPDTVALGVVPEPGTVALGVVPEPGTLALLISGGFGLLLLVWRRRTLS